MPDNSSEQNRNHSEFAPDPEGLGQGPEVSHQPETTETIQLETSEILPSNENNAELQELGTIDQTPQEKLRQSMSEAPVQELGSIDQSQKAQEKHEEYLLHLLNNEGGPNTDWEKMNDEANQLPGMM